ncbi:MAG: hypothetical protein PHE73_09300 [Sulfurovaceae bacterium]|nr:hypothetical protein [Sulfurovaceae bacterium]
MKEDILKFSQTEIEEKLEEIEIPERFKNIINTGNIKKKIGNTKIILKPNEGYYREDGEEFEIPEKYKNMNNTGKMQKKYGDNFPIPEYVTPVNNEVI